MRRSLAAALSAVMLAVSLPIVGVAQGSASATATVQGQVVSAGGTGQSGLTVELVSEGLVVSSTLTVGDGHFRFAGLPAGSYVVRTMLGGQPSGIRVTATAGSTAPALIVLPSLAKASPAVIVAVIGPALSSVVVATVSVVANQVVVTAQSDSDLTFLQTNQQAAQQFLDQVATQIGLPTGPDNPLVFVPTTPASGTT